METGNKIWVDADACPKVIKEILFRAADRTRTLVTLVANTYIMAPPSPYIRSLQVPEGFDIADDRIVELCEKRNLVITADIPLAARVIEKGGFALNPRGMFYDSNNIGPILSTRNFMHSMRSAVNEGSDGPSALTVKDREKFSNELNKFLTRKR